MNYDPTNLSWQTGSMQDNSGVGFLCVTVYIQWMVQQIRQRSSQVFLCWTHQRIWSISHVEYVHVHSPRCSLMYNWLRSPCYLFLSEMCGSLELVSLLWSDTYVSYQWTRLTTSLSFCCLDWYSTIISVEDNGNTAECQRCVSKKSN